MICYNFVGLFSPLFYGDNCENEVEDDEAEGSTGGTAARRRRNVPELNDQAEVLIVL